MKASSQSLESRKCGPTGDTLEYYSGTGWACCVNGGAENASTGKRKYGKCKYNANLQSDKKKFGTSQVSVVYFQVGWASGLQIVF